MIRVLLKKQLTEIFRSYFVNQKKNTPRSKAATALLFVLFVLIMVGVMGGMFAFLAVQLCQPMSMVGVGWLYFAIMGLLGILLGTFGSVFNTFAGLYLGKDNDLLLSMPVPIRSILTARLLGVYLMGLMYSAVVVLPALIVYWVTASFTVQAVICGLVWMLLISVIVLILSCLLGWVVAKLSVRLKGKSYLTVLLALVFIALYYFVYFKAQTLIRDVVSNAVLYGEAVKGKAKIVYYFGRAAEGGWAELLLTAAVVLGLFALTCWVLAKTFLKIATATPTETKSVYREKTARARSADAALLGKEFTRFSKSATYMLNNGLGILFLVALSVFLLIKGGELLTMVENFLPQFPGIGAIITVSMICMLSSTIIAAAPSVSLEGKSIWLLHSLPVRAAQVLKAKYRMQLILCGLPTLLAALCAAIVMPGEALLKLLTVAAAAAFALCFSLLCLFFGLKMPNLSWTNEITPIKQGGAVLLAMLGGSGVSLIPVALYFLVFDSPDPKLFLAVEAAVYLVLAVLLQLWFKKRGAECFEALQ